MAPGDVPFCEGKVGFFPRESGILPLLIIFGHLSTPPETRIPVNVRHWPARVCAGFAVGRIIFICILTDLILAALSGTMGFMRKGYGSHFERFVLTRKQFGLSSLVPK